MTEMFSIADLPTDELEKQLSELKDRQKVIENELKLRRKKNADIVADCGLTLQEIRRFSRHLLLPEFGVSGQVRISKNRAGVLVVGAGGLGCPALQFLASSGVARIGIVDHDTVDVSNLHRQILHTETRIGMAKAVSAKLAIEELNSDIEVIAYKFALDSRTALNVIGNYDVVLDCSDNVATRYLLNDACVLKDIPLVSGSALRFEGQLTVYNYRGGPTYRCLYPTPPPPEMVTNCSDGGVLGPVPAVIGVLQAIEAIKILSDFGEVLSGKLLLFDAINSSFRTIRLRNRSNNAAVEKLIDYEQFCGSKATDKDDEIRLLTRSDRISAAEFSEVRKPNHILVDVRTEPEMKICAIENSLNIPMQELDKDETIETLKRLLNDDNGSDIFVVCRRGNDSQIAVQRLRQNFEDSNVRIRDIVGGLHAWANTVDPTFPVY